MAATAPLTPARLRGLAVVAAVLLFAVGALVGQATRRRALFSLGDISWGGDAVTVASSGGNTGLALGALVVVLAVIAGVCWWGGRFAAARAFADIEGARRWATVAAAVWAVAVVGAVVGWVTTDTGDGLQATRVADHLRDEGGDVQAEITAGESSVVRPGGTGGTQLTAPVVVTYIVDGRTCTVVVDDPVTADDGTVTLTPSC